MDIKEHGWNISRGRNRAKQKIKEVRQKFSKAVVSDNRSSSVSAKSCLFTLI